AEYNRLVSAGQLARARALLGHLAATRENYVMVDDDFQLPVVAARYLADPRVPADRKRAFLRADEHLTRLVSNLAFVARKAASYARAPVATNLVSFPRAPDGGGTWISASWRASRAGYGGGRLPRDVHAYRAMLAAVPPGVVRGRARSHGRERRLCDAGSVGWVSPGSIPFSDGSLGAGRECSARGPGAAAPRW